MAIMILMDDQIRSLLPKLYSQDKLKDDAIAYVKYFTPWTNWTWYATEFDGVDTFFGLIYGFEREWGYFSLSELSELKGPFELSIELDLYFHPKTIKEIKKEHGNEDDAFANTPSEDTEISSEDIPKACTAGNSSPQMSDIATTEIAEFIMNLTSIELNTRVKAINAKGNSIDPFGIFKFNKIN